VEDNEVIVKCNEILDVLKSKHIREWELNRVADAVSELSSLMVNLGQIKEDAKDIRDDAEARRKDGINQAFMKHRNSGKTGQESKILSEIDNAKLIEKEKEAIKSFNRINTYYDDVSRFISTSQSRLRTATEDKIRSNNEWTA